MKRGAILTIRVNDPAHILPIAEDTISSPHFVIGVQANSGAFFTAETTAKDTAGRTLTITIPNATPMRLLANSRVVRLLDQSGRVLTNVNGSIQLPLASANIAQPITLTVAPKFIQGAPPPPILIP